MIWLCIYKAGVCPNKCHHFRRKSNNGTVYNAGLDDNDNHTSSDNFGDDKYHVDKNGICFVEYDENKNQKKSDDVLINNDNNAQNDHNYGSVVNQSVSESSDSSIEKMYGQAKETSEHAQGNHNAYDKVVDQPTNYHELEHSGYEQPIEGKTKENHISIKKNVHMNTTSSLASRTSTSTATSKRLHQSHHQD